MLKFNNFFLTLAISLFAFFLSEHEGDLTIKKVPPTHDIKILNTLNSLAVSNHNSFHELLNFDTPKEPSQKNTFYANNSLNKSLITNQLAYLKVCDFIDLNLTPQDIIYPFHSFL